MTGQQLSFEDNVARARAAYRAFNEGDLAVLLRWLDPDVKWRRRGTHPVGGTYEGRDRVLQDVLTTIHEQFEEISFEPLEFIEHRGHMVVRIRQRGRGRASGAPVEGELAHALRVVEGKLIELRAFDSVEDAVKALDSESATGSGLGGG
jgi:ketosteroid isomerase-like protein